MNWTSGEDRKGDQIGDTAQLVQWIEEKMGARWLKIMFLIFRLSLEHDGNTRHRLSGVPENTPSTK
jgi:hypothetical protein